jgi:hypothetical protein
VVFWRVHALYLSADKSYRSLPLSVVSDNGSMCFLQDTLRCAVTSGLANHVSRIVLGTLKKLWYGVRVYSVQFNGIMSLTSYFDITYIINIKETTYS